MREALRRQKAQLTTTMLVHSARGADGDDGTLSTRVADDGPGVPLAGRTRSIRRRDSSPQAAARSARGHLSHAVHELHVRERDR